MRPTGGAANQSRTKPTTTRPRTITTTATRSWKRFINKPRNEGEPRDAQGSCQGSSQGSDRASRSRNSAMQDTAASRTTHESVGIPIKKGTRITKSKWIYRCRGLIDCRCSCAVTAGSLLTYSIDPSTHVHARHANGRETERNWRIKRERERSESRQGNIFPALPLLVSFDPVSLSGKKIVLDNPRQSRRILENPGEFSQGLSGDPLRIWRAFRNRKDHKWRSQSS